ncbi:YqgQ family protein [Ammoniphilus sp. CFH 90114]|uniref:YqgQ family protein n=1 Tax=Ammoniphilus sp. CFH 90114 TaxID=2493665 RepID=UPI00100FD58B|nr:YqgQ family protein [Ammoniphilus sp. CFH 90114]RXT05854.1 DUF910 family protein [Ammoniphilus sp. CFH 90114]
MKPMSFTEAKELLRTFGIVIYTGNALGDCILMEDEIMELHQAGLLGDPDIFRSALMAVRKRKTELNQNPYK